MLEVIKKSIWSQFCASINTLENAIAACPDELWNTENKFWYNAYHCLFFLDYYLTLNPENFVPPPPFNLSEFDEGELPANGYTKNELLHYLQFCRNKCHTVISGLTEELAVSYWTNVSRTMKYPVIEILIYNLRHVQHHSAQLNLLLRQEANIASDWVFKTEIAL